MKKSKVIIVLITILVLAIALCFIRKGTKTNTQETLDISKMSPEEAAQELKPYIKDMEEKEIKEILNQELTEEQQKLIEDTFSDVANMPEIDEVISREENLETGTIKVKYKSTDGNEYSYEVPIPEEMTPEEIEQATEELNKKFEAAIKTEPNSEPDTEPTDTTETVYEEPAAEYSDGETEIEVHGVTEYADNSTDDGESDDITFEKPE